MGLQNDGKRTITCLYCENKGHIQANWRTRIRKIYYDPRASSFISEISLEHIDLRTTRAVHFDAFRAVTVHCTLSKWCNNNKLETVTCHIPEQPSIFFSPSVNSVFEEDKVMVVIKNCSPNTVALPLGTNIGFAEPVSSVHSINDL